ncbi:hypothetical protein TNCV_4870871 [Trichonephila clavipes]|nr:hypothetical protein TNCV_4870871 [Trichonephila clavipes]
MFLHHHLPPKLNSCRPPLQYPLVTLSLNHPIPTCTDAPSKNMVTPLESSSSIIPTSSSQSVIPPPSDSNTVQDAKKLAKARSRKKKRITEKMKEAIIDIK